MNHSQEERSGEPPLGVNAWYDRGRRTGAGNWLVTASVVMFFVLTAGFIAFHLLTGRSLPSSVTTTIWSVNALIGVVGVCVLGSGVLALRKYDLKATVDAWHRGGPARWRKAGEPW
jgi:hypothetical protein